MLPTHNFDNFALFHLPTHSHFIYMYVSIFTSMQASQETMMVLAYSIYYVIRTWHSVKAASVDPDQT